MIYNIQGVKSVPLNPFEFSMLVISFVFHHTIFLAILNQSLLNSTLTPYVNIKKLFLIFQNISNCKINFLVGMGYYALSLFLFFLFLSLSLSLFFSLLIFISLSLWLSLSFSLSFSLFLSLSLSHLVFLT